MSLKGVLKEWLEHRSDVLVRRSKHRLDEIERRLEILAGYLIAYLNIDEVIRIIREEDEPKQLMMARFAHRHPGRSHPQHAPARLAQARRDRDPQGVRRPHRREEADRSAARLGRQAMGDDQVGSQPAFATKFGPETELGKRRTTVRRCARARPDRHRARHDRARAGHRGRLGKGLAAGDEGPSDRPLDAHLQGGRQPQARLPRRRPRTRSWSSPPAASSTRSAPTGCRAGAAMASRSASWSTWTTTRTSSPPSSTTRSASCCWSPTTATALSCRRTRSSPTPARASR